MIQFIVVNPSKCIGCGTCLLACSTAHKEVGRQANPRLNLVLNRDVSAAVTCHHCQGAPCALVCPVNAIKQEDGRVVVDEKTCISCKMCALVCPFGAVRLSGTPLAGVAGIQVETPTFPKGTSDVISWEIGVHAAAVKCDLCSFTPEGPSCIGSCLTKAISLVDATNHKKILANKRTRAAVEQAVITKSTTERRGGK